MTSLSVILQQKLAQDYKNQQNQLKEIKQKLFKQCELMEDKILRELQKINETSKLINKAAEFQTKIYNESLNSEQYSTDLIDFNTLSKYLKKEKAHLSDIVSSSEQSNKQSKSGKDLLHKLSNKKKMQKHLQHLQSFKLQKEIEYLQKNILIGQTKDGKQNIVYEDVESVTIKEEKQQVEKLKLSIEELERLVSLSNECGGNVNNQLFTKISQLNIQTERLQIIQHMLEKETKEIVQVKEFFKDYQPTQTFNFLNQSLMKSKQYQIPNVKQKNSKESNLTQEEIDFLLNFTLQTSNMQIFKKPFEQVNNSIKTCKNKLKKLKV